MAYSLLIIECKENACVVIKYFEIFSKISGVGVVGAVRTLKILYHVNRKTVTMAIGVLACGFTLY